jgi:hypothetical protein
VTTDTLRSTNVFINNVRLLASAGLQQVTNVSNTTSNTISLTNPTTGLTVDSNVVVGGNVTADYFVGDGSNLTGITGGIDTTQTLALSNVTTGLTVDSNVVVSGNVTTDTLRSTNVFINNVRLLASAGLQQVTNVSNTTSNTISLTNPTTGLTVDSNVVVSGNVTTDTLRSTNVFINNVRLLASAGLQQATNVSNTTGDTIISTNAATGFQASSNVVVGGDIHLTGNIYQNGTIFTGGGGSSGSTSVIAPVAFAFVDTTANSTGTGISWGSWNSSNHTLDFTFDTAQSDANYSVITDSETFDDFFVGISNKTTTGFRAEFYDNSQSRTPSTFSPFTFIIYASTPTIDVSGGSGGGGGGIDTTQTLALSNVTTGLTVSSNAVVGGNVTADYFIGDGSNLTGISGGVDTTQTLALSNVTTGLTVSSNAVVSGNVTAGSFIGDGSNLTGISGGIDTTSTVQFTNPNVGIVSTGGIVTHSGGFNRKTYAYSNVSVPTNFSNVGLTFASNVFYAKITTQLTHGNEEVSTLVFDAQGGTRDGTTSSLNIATGSGSLFGNTNTKPWSATIQKTPTKLILEPSAVGTTNYGCDLFVEYMSSAPDGQLESISIGTDIVKSFIY